MMMRKSLVVVAVGAALVVAAFAASNNAQKSAITVGDFAVKVSTAMGQPVSDRNAAVQSLRTLGVKISDANASLTEGMAAKILADLGLRVSTTNPGGAVSSGKADQLASIAGLASTSSSIAPQDGLPTQCLNSPNRGTCQECCKTALGCAPSPALCDFASSCAKFCKTVPPPGHQSPSDPNP
jgi:hypothetical protein